jgi:hypothetical protein
LASAQFGEPHHIEPPPLGGVYLLEREVEGYRFSAALRLLKFVKHVLPPNL